MVGMVEKSSFIVENGNKMVEISRIMVKNGNGMVEISRMLVEVEMALQCCRKAVL